MEGTHKQQDLDHYVSQSFANNVRNLDLDQIDDDTDSLKVLPLFRPTKVYKKKK